MDIKNWKPADVRDVRNFLEMLRQVLSIRKERIAVYVSYLLYLRNQFDKENKLTLSQLLEAKFGGKETDLEFVLRDYFTEKDWEGLQKGLPVVDDKILETVILDTTGEYWDMVAREPYPRADYTPDSLVTLVTRLLDIQGTDKVYDLCGGIGNFTVKSYLAQPEASYYSKEVNSASVAIMAMRADVLQGEEHIQAEAGDVFDLVKGEALAEEDKFDKVFGNYPWMMELHSLSELENSKVLEEFQHKLPELYSRGASDWLFNALIVSIMKDSGKAIAIMPNNSTWSRISSSSKIRRHFLLNGLIEAVIALPRRMFKDTPIPSTLVVFSRGNRDVKLIDATKIYTERMRQNILDSEHVEAILKAYTEDSEISCVMDARDMVVAYDSVIHPSRYVRQHEPVKDGVPLKTVLENMYRGAGIGARQLEGMLTEETTKYRYVMLKHINEGVIDEELPYLSSLDERYARAIAPHHSVILSKMGPQFKSAVVEVEHGQEFVINGNMFILEVNKHKINPYYLQALFESSYGSRLISKISLDGTIPTITKGDLEELIIPLPSLDQQNKIATEYLSLQDEIKIYRKKLANASAKKNQIFDEWLEE